MMMCLLVHHVIGARRCLMMMMLGARHVLHQAHVLPAIVRHFHFPDRLILTEIHSRFDARELGFLAQTSLINVTITADPKKVPSTPRQILQNSGHFTPLDKKSPNCTFIHQKYRAPHPNSKSRRRVSFTILAHSHQ